jgi:hypothetical protein
VRAATLVTKATLADRPHVALLFRLETVAIHSEAIVLARLGTPLGGELQTLLLSEVQDLAARNIKR